MKQALLIFGFAAVIASSLVISSPSSAKTVKACDEEWKANKATIQASGKKKKDFITECRAETASTNPRRRRQLRRRRQIHPLLLLALAPQKP